VTRLVSFKGKKKQKHSKGKKKQKHLVLDTDSGNDWLVYTGNEAGDRLPVRVFRCALGKLQGAGIHIEHQAHFVALRQPRHPHLVAYLSATDIVPAVAKSVGVSSPKVVPRLAAAVAAAPRLVDRDVWHGNADVHNALAPPLYREVYAVLPALEHLCAKANRERRPSVLL
jgi:hypothetical protein